MAILKPSIWRPINPPGPKGVPIIGNLHAFMTRPLEFLSSAAHQHGDIVLLSTWPFRTYLLSHPDHIKDLFVTHHRDFMQGHVHQVMKFLLGEGLITSEGDLHLRQRRLIQPEFHRRRIAAYSETIAKSWTMRLAQGYRLELEPLITLLPRHGMPMTIHSRKVSDMLNDATVGRG